MDRFQSSADAGSFHDFALSGGWDPLHLSGHLGETGSPDVNSRLFRDGISKTSGAFITSTMDAWYTDLSAKATDLKMIGTHSWKVDVFVKPVGFLGTFRRSAQTGLWFAGRHRYHSAGN
ncbi:hypothetical protein [Subtercola boreus]|uniref:hypothetical protein n=1 Tax=Subtercola boreus TaxID=120213 RepID=UPI0011C0271A|nr:hypothetical protein [Subtercola boreus]